MALVLVSGLVLAGCGGSSTAKTVTVGGGSTAAPKTTSGTTSPPAATGATAAPPLATRTGTVDRTPVSLAITQLKRENGTTSLQIQLSTTDPDARAQVASSFDNGLFEKLTAPGAASSTAGADTLDGIYLLDGKNRKKYLVGRDSQGACTCDGDLGSGFVTTTAPLTLSATYGAPPADVTSIDVFVPRFGTFKDVPLS